MSRPNFDATLKTEVAKPLVGPVLLAKLTLKSGVERVWSGVGPLTWNGEVYSGLGEFVSMGSVTESSAVQADGTSVTLAISPSMVAVPDYPVTPPDPPYTPVAGESLAWSFATHFPPMQILASDSGEIYATGVFSATTAGMSFIAGNPLGGHTLGGAWYGFHLPLAVPAGARITRVIPVVIEDTDFAFNCQLSCSSAAVGTTIFGPGTNPNIGPDLKTLSSLVINSTLESTLSGGFGACSAAMSNIAVAVYYEGSPLTVTSLIYEAVNDIRLGAPAKIWMGMWRDGALVGTPYLVFKGTVDQPKVSVGLEGGSITLALENRLSNLQRASNRKYTAADQHLDFPDDMGFNWQEIIQEISLKEGS